MGHDAPLTIEVAADVDLTPASTVIDTGRKTIHWAAGGHSDPRRVLEFACSGGGYAGPESAQASRCFGSAAYRRRRNDRGDRGVMCEIDARGAIRRSSSAHRPRRGSRERTRRRGRTLPLPAWRRRSALMTGHVIDGMLTTVEGLGGRRRVVGTHRRGSRGRWLRYWRGTR